MLREAIAQQSPLGIAAKDRITSGQLVSDEIAMQLIQDRLEQIDCQNGFVLDGFPRTLTQAKMLYEAKIKLDKIFELIVPDDIIIERFQGRRIHPGSGRTYHIRYQPPRIPDQDDITGEPLIQRSDDNILAIQKRLVLYHENIKPLKQYYQSQPQKQNPFIPEWIPLAADIPIISLQHQIETLLVS
jgi:adenylate kinase